MGVYLPRVRTPGARGRPRAGARGVGLLVDVVPGRVAGRGRDICLVMRLVEWPGSALVVPADRIQLRRVRARGRARARRRPGARRRPRGRGGSRRRSRCRQPAVPADRLQAPRAGRGRRGPGWCSRRGSPASVPAVWLQLGRVRARGRARPGPGARGTGCSRSMGRGRDVSLFRGMLVLRTAGAWCSRSTRSSRSTAAWCSRSGLGLAAELRFHPTAGT